MYLQIAIKNFSQQTLTYQTHVATQNLIGYRVIVPFGKTEKIGLVVGTETNTSLEADKIRSSVGLGMDWLTAIGPLTFSLAHPITKADTDVTEMFRFNLGTSF